MTDGKTVSIKKSTLKMSALVVVVFVFGYLIGSSTTANVVGDSRTVEIKSPPSVAPQQPQPAQVDASGPTKGDDNAPVTIIEFSDFQCPYCGRFYDETLPLIEENYIKTGKVKLVYKHFPLGFHQNAQKASEASECANEQGKFWKYHDMIFDNQDAIDIASLNQYAVDIGLDETKFSECLDSGRMSQKVTNDINEGSAAGVTGTPSFFINGRQITGAQPYSVFTQAIDAELS